MNEQLNERIAREVMGWSYGSLPGTCVNKWWRRRADGFLDVRFDGLDDYSGDIGAAWDVIIEIAKRGINCEFDCIDGEWNCCMYDDEHEGNAYNMTTAPLAICMAALDIVAKLAK
jgi:hypothetical protein